jgi:hypothetical protein
VVFGIGARLGVSLGPHGCAQCPVELGAAPLGRYQISLSLALETRYLGAIR